MRSNVRTLFAAGSLIVAAVGPAFAQSARIVGTVTAEATGQPVAGVQVFLEGTSYGALTQENGGYLLLNVPAGTYNLVAQFLGYAPGRQENVQVGGDGTVTVDFALRTTVLQLEEVVVTGVTSPTSGLKVPFTVAKVSRESLPVPAVNVEASIRGRVAGARVVKGSGQPGTGVSIDLRGATSIERGNEPLYVVDGVILGSNNLIDIDALDIASIEVVKGAAAASLYGSRAANGVVQIRTRRGSGVAEGDTRIVLRSEFGTNQLADSDVELTRSHHYQVNSDGSYALDEDGNRQAEADFVADNPFPRYFDQLDRFFDPGEFMTNQLSIAQNTRSTNFYLSIIDRQEEGIVDGNEGFGQRSARLNIDHRLRDDVNVSVSTAYSRSNRDLFVSDPFYDLMFMPADADLLAPNPDGEPYIIQPDPYLLQANPLYAIHFADENETRSRVLGNINVRYAPANWFSLDANLSYDRLDGHYNQFVPKGFKTLGDEDTGDIDRDNELNQMLNGGLRAAFLRSFGELTTQLQLQYTLERENYREINADGEAFVVEGVEDIDAASVRSASTEVRKIRSEGYYAIGEFDYAGKYIASALIRRDGSSLFGPEERFNNYYRVSAAWRLSEEDWWPSDQINEFKIRFARGTAGNRPNFFDRYETWSVSGGSVSKSTLGNADLRPELQTENEVGLDLIALNRYSLRLTYADSKVEDQLLEIPLPAVYGYGTQWQNAGTVESNTIEATIEAAVLNRGESNLTLGLTFDRTRGRITEFDRGCFRDGPQSAFYVCEGETLGSMYGGYFLHGSDRALVGGSADQFDVNNDGLLVAVGAGNAWTDGWGPDGQSGTADDLWGTTVTIDGVDYGWGLPIAQIDADGNVALVKIGDSNPDFNMGFTADYRWKNVRLNMLFDAQFGGDIYNNTRQWTYRDYNHGDYDQAGKPTAEQKPVGYYQALYDANSIRSWFVEDGTFVKFRQLSASYTLDGAQLGGLLGSVAGGISRLTLSVIGRNLLTFTDYSGFDPEVGSGDATRLRFDGFGYPNFRTLTAAVEIEF